MTALSITTLHWLNRQPIKNRRRAGAGGHILSQYSFIHIRDVIVIQADLLKSGYQCRQPSGLTLPCSPQGVGRQALLSPLDRSNRLALSWLTHSVASGRPTGAR
jgi:hypothetical protein